MDFRQPHSWDLNAAQAVALQKQLARKIIYDGKTDDTHLIAGVDVSVDWLDRTRAAVVILTWPELKIIETAAIEGRTVFPYIPGLLSFREIPLLLEAFQRLERRPDLIMVDGQGVAHPRKIGLASHLGLTLDIPAIGCAKSHLYGEFSAPENEAGSFSYLKDNEGAVIGAVLRTKTGVKPLFISIGHKINLSSALRWVLQCCRGYRLPEPSRCAHQASRDRI